MNQSNARYLLSATAILLLTALWKLGFLLSGVIQMNSDEAVVALMARHILQGERPVFFYGQAYMGSLDAWLVSGLFALFGESVTAIRMVQLLLYLGIVLTTILIGRMIFKSWRPALAAGLLLAVPTVNATLYTTASLGGYGEALLLGNLQLLTAFSIARKMQPGETSKPRLAFLLWGLFAGLGLWANGLTLVFSAPSGLLLLWVLWRQDGRLRWRRMGANLGLILIGFLAGSSPWWLYALQDGAAHLVGELGGGAVNVESQSWLVRTGSHFINFLLLGCTALFGFRPPWEVRWLALPLLPLALAFWLAVVWFLARQSIRENPARPAFRVLSGVALVVTSGFLFTPFGIDPSGRYFLPLSAPLALAAGAMVFQIIQKRRWQVGILAVIILFQGWGTVQSALRFPPGLTTQFYAPSIIDHRADQELIAFLKAQGETRGYGNYWVTYPLAFASNEEVIFPPALPYHADLTYTSRDDRYRPYAEMAAASPRTAFISTTRLPEVNTALRAQFSKLEVTWQERQIGDYVVFYRLSRPVHPVELGFDCALTAQEGQP